LRARADVVGVFNWYHGLLAYQTALARAMAKFTFVGIPLFHTERPWAGSPLFARILARCDLVVAMTEHEKRFVDRRSGRVTGRVVGAGVEPAAFTGGDGSRLRAEHGLDRATVVGYIGRMSATKGVVTLIEAMKIVWSRDPSVRLLLAGSGLPPASVSDAGIRAAFAALSEAERSRIATVSSFTDAQKASLFDAVDVFAMPSVAESFGIAYLEAWMCGKPVIGSRIPSTEWVIRDGVDGMLAEPDVPEDLARCIHALTGDRDTRERMGRAGHERALALFTWDKVVDSIENAYLDARAQQDTGLGLRRVVA
jgi:glycosyltransferase involved in cell wall biosynthesis